MNSQTYDRLMKGDRIETGVEEEETNFRIFIFRPLYTSGVRTVAQFPTERLISNTICAKLEK